MTRRSLCQVCKQVVGTADGSVPVVILRRQPNMANADVAKQAGCDCAIQHLYKMFLCSVCLPLAAAVFLGSLPLLFFAPWGILYMALVTWPKKSRRDSDGFLRTRRRPRISRRESTRSHWKAWNASIYTDGGVPAGSSTPVTDFLVNTVRPLTCSLYAVLWFAFILGRLAWIAIWPGPLDAAEQPGAGDVAGEADLPHSQCQAQDASLKKKRNKRGGMKQYQSPRQITQVHNKKAKRKSSKHPCDHFESLQDVWTDALLAIRWEKLRSELENHMRSHEQVIRSWKTSVFRRPQQRHTQRVCAEKYDVSALLAYRSSDAVVDSSTRQHMRAVLERRGIHYTMSRRDDVHLIRVFPLKGGTPKRMCSSLADYLQAPSGQMDYRAQETSKPLGSSLSTSSTNAAGSSSSQHGVMSPELRRCSEC